MRLNSLVFALFFVCANHCCAQTIVTVVGGGTNGGLPSGGPATASGMCLPVSVACDKYGNVYIANAGTNTICKVNTAGVVSNYAGIGFGGFGGDGGPAAAAMLNGPLGICVDTFGNLYIADYYNNRIREIDTTGTISTIVGDGSGMYWGDGWYAAYARVNGPTGVALDKWGHLYIADSYDNRIREIDSAGIMVTVAGNGTIGYSGDGGPADSAELNHPVAVTLDTSGNLYIADQSNNVIRGVGSSGTIITVAGNGTLGYSGDGGIATAAEIAGPTGLAVDPGGNLYISDNGNNRIRVVNSSNVIATLVGNGIAGYAGDGGPATAGELNSPQGLALDAAGNIYIADYQNYRVRKINTSHTISTFAGDGSNGFEGDGGPATAAVLLFPIGVAVDNSNNILVADEHAFRIRRANNAGIIYTIAGDSVAGYSGDGGPAIDAELTAPQSVIFDKHGNIYIADFSDSRIRKVDTSGVISTFAGTGTYGFSGDGGPATAAWLEDPTGLAIDKYGNIYFADYGNARVRKIDTSGIITTIAGNGFVYYSGGTYPATDAPIGPMDVAVNSMGNIFIADFGDNCVVKLDTSGNISDFAGLCYAGYGGDGGLATAAVLYGTTGVAVDAYGNVFIADYYNSRVRVVNAAGIITTFAGTGVQGYSGDGGPASAAELYSPSGIALDAFGNLYIADVDNNTVRKVTLLAPLGVPAAVNSPPKIQLYPNPAVDKVFIMPARQAASGKVALYNAAGQEMNVPIKGNANFYELSVSGLVNGSYFVIYSDKQGNQSAVFDKIGE